ncbi:hypothetical protein [Shewanella phage FishSpeaker]|nr:hypothetical protein [Shewanella phage FishSpeaker]
MLVIDVKTIYEYAGLSFAESFSKLFLGSSITDCVYTCLVDLGFNPVNGRYVVVPETVKKLLLLHLEQKLIGIPTNTIITLNEVYHFVYVYIR